jgi:hypothetical protein
VAQGSDLSAIMINCTYSFWTDQREIWTEGILDNFPKDLVVVEVEAIGANDCLNTFFRVEDAAHACTITSMIELGASPLDEGTNSQFPNLQNIGRPILGRIAKEFRDVFPRSRKQILRHKALNPGT